MTVQLGLPVLRKETPRTSLLPAPQRRPAGQPSGLFDRFGRRATDMRLSVTDKCNLRCTYCMPAEGLEWLPQPAVMTAEEIVRIVGIGVGHLGVRELRLTGGEPLVRGDLVDIVRALRARHPGLAISMTTNAVGLDRKAQALKDAGLTRLNAVLMRGINDHEAPDLLAWALENGHELRFIEQMPLDADHGWSRREMITAAEIRQLLEARFVLSRDPRNRDGAPAERFRAQRRDADTGGPSGPVLGTVGIIASVTEPFCSDCRRTRITAEGTIMSCLFSRHEFDLLGLLRDGASDDELAQRWEDAMWAKPKAHGREHIGLDADDFVQPDRTMSAIGG